MVGRFLLYFKEFTVASVERMDWGGKVRVKAGNIFVCFVVVQVRDAGGLDRSVTVTCGVWFLFGLAWQLEAFSKSLLWEMCSWHSFSQKGTGFFQALSCPNFASCICHTDIKCYVLVKHSFWSQRKLN